MSCTVALADQLVGQFDRFPDVPYVLMRRGPVVAFAISSVLSTVGAVSFLKIYLGPKDGDSVRFVDTREEIDALLRESVERSAAAPVTPADPSAEPSNGGIRKLKRRALTKSEAETFFPGLRPPSRFVYDEVAYMTLRPRKATLRKWAEHPDGQYRRAVNAQGFSRKAPISETPPALRVLVVGDSHLQGVVSTDENLCAIMEAELARTRPGETIEVLNAGQGGTTFYNYLAVVERYLELEPDVVICLAYTGNDFGGAVRLRRLFESIVIEPRDAASAARAAALRDAKLPGAGQCINQGLTFVNSPQLEQIGLDAGCEVMAQLAQTCAASSVEFVCVRLPSALVAQPARYKSLMDDAKSTMGLGDAPFEVEPRISLTWMERLSNAGTEVLDLAPHFSRVDRDLYWHKDLHLSVEGHHIAGEVLARHIEDRLLALEPK